MTTRSGAGVPLRSVALPVEHGGWGFLLEPLLVGLCVAPALGSLLLGVAALAGFLLRHPLKVALGERRHGRSTARTTLAVRFVCIYGVLAAASFGAALTAASPAFWIPVAGAAPLVLLQLRFDARGQGRVVAAQMTGALALTAIAPTLVLAAGWPLAAAFALWAILAARAVSSILYVRARLRMARGREAGRLPAFAAHAAGIALAWCAAAAGLAPWLAVALFVFLGVRAIAGLYGGGPTRTKQVGWQEVAFAAVTVLLLTAGYRLGV